MGGFFQIFVAFSQYLNFTGIFLFLKTLLALKDMPVYAKWLKGCKCAKIRFLASQKMAEQKKNEAMIGTNAALKDNGIFIWDLDLNFGRKELGI